MTINWVQVVYDREIINQLPGAAGNGPARSMEPPSEITERDYQESIRTSGLKRPLFRYIEEATFDQDTTTLVVRTAKGLFIRTAMCRGRRVFNFSDRLPEKDRALYQLIDSLLSYFADAHFQVDDDKVYTILNGHEYLVEDVANCEGAFDRCRRAPWEVAKTIIQAFKEVAPQVGPAIEELGFFRPTYDDNLELPIDWDKIETETPVFLPEGFSIQYDKEEGGATLTFKVNQRVDAELKDAFVVATAEKVEEFQNVIADAQRAYALQESR